MLLLKNYSLCGKTWPTKKPEVFQNSVAGMVSTEKCIHWPSNFLHKQTYIFQGLIA